MFSLDSFYNKYDTETAEIVIRGRKFEILLPGSLDTLIDGQDLFHDFPLWSKIWEASWILADYLAGMKVEPERTFLEIGSGIGLASIVAASFGHNVTMTERDARSLEFARANARLNGCPDLKIRELDWHRPRMKGPFDYILGSEIAYQEKSFEPLRKLIESFLKPDGEVILASEMRRTSLEFYRQMQAFFNLKAQKKVLRSENRVIRVVLCRMTRNR